MIATRDERIIATLIKAFTQQNQDLIKTLLQLQYYFRGALNRDDVWAMSPAERELAVEFLNGRFKDAAEMMKKEIPVFL